MCVTNHNDDGVLTFDREMLKQINNEQLIASAYFLID
jgi:hypothetical protein